MTSWHIRKAVQLLFQGAVIAYPTETVWGLGCIPDYADSLFRILRIKQRSVDKGVILLGSDIAQFSRWILPMTVQQQRLITSPTERPTTWIVPAAANCPYWISGGRDTLAIRLSDHPVVCQLCDSVGALVSTSANKSGKLPKLTRSECLMTFNQKVNWVVPGRSGVVKQLPDSRFANDPLENKQSAKTQPSKIIELATGKVLRT